MKSFRLWLYRCCASCLPETRFWGLKSQLLRWAGACIGDNVRICSSVKIYGSGNLIIGNDVWIGHETQISTGIGGDVNICDAVDISDRVIISTGSHEIDFFGCRSAGIGTQKSIVIKEGAWLGMGVIILQGVNVGRKCVVGAGAVVTRDLDECCVCVGVPARRARCFSKA